MGAACTRLVVKKAAQVAGVSLTTTFFEGMPIVGLRESPHFGLNIVVKRVMDVVLSALALVLLAPLLLLLAAVVKLTSPGPVFYRQERCGLNGHSFPTVTIAVTMFCSLARCARLLMNCVFPLP